MHKSWAQRSGAWVKKDEGGKERGRVYEAQTSPLRSEGKV